MKEKECQSILLGRVEDALTMLEGYRFSSGSYVGYGAKHAVIKGDDMVLLQKLLEDLAVSDALCLLP